MDSKIIIYQFDPVERLFHVYEPFLLNEKFFTLISGVVLRGFSIKNRLSKVNLNRRLIFILKKTDYIHPQI